ncbi:MAG TPA: hypothetical protein VJ833_12685 [Rhodanobacteraceae bacterium]|nr:hypothetical protein [Rhodanobacteraceae bacterium]
MTWQRGLGLRFRFWRVTLRRAQRALTTVAIMGKGVSSQTEEKPIVLMPFAAMEAGDPLLAFAPHQ